GTIPSRLGKVIACKVSTTPEMHPTSSGFGTHGTAEHIEFIDNDVSNVFNGFFLRGGYIHVKRNNFYGKMSYGVVHPDGSNHFIEDNHYSSNMIGKEVGNLNAPMIAFGNLTTDKQDGVIQYK